MIAYHGTTQARARTILAEGLLPKPPSRLVWFAESRAYAMGRARTWAARTRDVPVVLECSLDLEKLRRSRDVRSVIHRKGIIAVDGPVPVEMFGPPAFADMATVPGEVAAWINDLLGLEGEESVTPKHPGVGRLSRWVNSRAAERPAENLRSSELLEMARRWLPERFVGARLDDTDLRRHRRVGLTDYDVDGAAPAREADLRETEAFECLDSPAAAERARGIALLAEARAPDLFEWCAIFLEDAAVTVRVAALRGMLGCEGGDAGTVEPSVHSPNKRVRAAAVAAMIALDPGEAARWIERGLKDPETCVRREAARFLGTLDARRHRALFDLAKHDPNPDVARKARSLASGPRRRKEKR